MGTRLGDKVVCLYVGFLDGNGDDGVMGGIELGLCVCLWIGALLGREESVISMDKLNSSNPSHLSVEDGNEGGGDGGVLATI